MAKHFSEMLAKEDAWLKAHAVTHAHCPEGCEHPQPFFHGDLYLCGACAWKHNRATEMEACTCD